MFHPKQVKNDFPIFFHKPDLVYLDSAATALKPISVINKIDEYYKKYSANIHRGIYEIAEKATEEYEETRKIIALFIHARRPEEIIFTRGTTEGINLVASSFGSEIVMEGDEIVTTILEHHSNFVPWQQLAFAAGADFKVIDINDNYELAVLGKNHKINLGGVITKKTKILALALVSNTLGTINPVKEIIAEAKKINPSLIVVVDAAQAIPHIKVNVKELGADFVAFSSHKMLGPTGVGILWGKYELLEKMQPYQYGGDMIREVRIEKTVFNSVPYKFEAGTPNIADVIALKEAVAYIQYYGLDEIRAHEKKLVEIAVRKLKKEFGEEITLYGPSNIEHRGGVVSFSFKDIHPHDIAQILDEDKIAVRAGHHCTMPLHEFLKVPATTRASFYLYNDEEDIEKLIMSLRKAKKLLSK